MMTTSSFASVLLFCMCSQAAEYSSIYGHAAHGYGRHYGGYAAQNAWEWGTGAVDYADRVHNAAHPFGHFHGAAHQAHQFFDGVTDPGTWALEHARTLPDTGAHYHAATLPDTGAHYHAATMGGHASHMGGHAAHIGAHAAAGGFSAGPVGAAVGATVGGVHLTCAAMRAVDRQRRAEERRDDERLDQYYGPGASNYINAASSSSHGLCALAGGAGGAALGDPLGNPRFLEHILKEAERAERRRQQGCTIA